MHVVPSAKQGSERSVPSQCFTFRRATGVQIQAAQDRRDGLGVVTIPGDLLTTAMGVMPHTDVDRALAIAPDIALFHNSRGAILTALGQGSQNIIKQRAKQGYVIKQSAVLMLDPNLFITELAPEYRNAVCIWT